MIKEVEQQILREGTGEDKGEEGAERRRGGGEGRGESKGEGSKHGRSRRCGSSEPGAVVKCPIKERGTAQEAQNQTEKCRGK